MMKKEEKEEEGEGGRSARIWDCGSPLYDSYELASVGRLLERHTRALPLPNDQETKKRTKKSNIIVQKAKSLRSRFRNLLGTFGLRRKKKMLV
ncbi:hypothetical protein RchiOBHm_Chr7g0195411 [Rosa chinensis]|uniref:Uncharacterized protein n=1 Tax=Rosa chinensis TaxID=74649 RepID=A0A2P6P6D4_ROSCH|nr:hypothetical protein RchiOBHm_Chr7g0195411 [Rosa chinensis]